MQKYSATRVMEAKNRAKFKRGCSVNDTGCN